MKKNSSGKEEKLVSQTRGRVLLGWVYLIGMKNSAPILDQVLQLWLSKKVLKMQNEDGI